jgi:hypothetical protein
VLPTPTHGRRRGPMTKTTAQYLVNLPLLLLATGCATYGGINPWAAVAASVWALVIMPEWT